MTTAEIVSLALKMDGKEASNSPAVAPFKWQLLDDSAIRMIILKKLSVKLSATNSGRDSVFMGEGYHRLRFSNTEAGGRAYPQMRKKKLAFCTANFLPSAMSVTIADFDALETHGTTLGGETDLILTDDIVIERRVNIAADKVIHFGAFKFIKSWSGEGTNGDEYGLTRISPPSAEDPFKGATGHAMLTVTTGGESKRPVHGTTVEVMGTGTYDGTFEVLASRQLPAPDTAKSEIVIALSFPGAPIDYNSPTTIKIRAVSIQFDGLGLVYIGRQTSNRLNFR